ncbi:uncharacterized protein LOC129615095 [Condylostylus longicornis]|uniref:uncharacterized protein LOC129615095 n=1 Tax=Condylostylus longicornis TaxID=2530218 RepID=UPI00244E372C|nr:uncharacterized protein LOC129615095 [Condylostylus longicornis]
MENELEAYFTDYEDLEVHEVMLKDRHRQEAYFNAIMSNKHLFEGKVILDVGAGTGILSMFAAKAGAKLVYAVEASNLAKIAIEIIEDNNLTSIVKVIHSKIENFQLPKNEDKVDIIISEWMGFYLLHEGMLDSVIFARDHFLKSNGYIFPQYATIYVAPCSVSSRYSYWDNVDGINMRIFGKRLRTQKSNKPEIINIDESEMLSKEIVMSWFDLKNITTNDLDEIQYEGVIPFEKAGLHQGFCIWFDCQFPSKNFESGVILSTSPYEKSQTHWKQCVIVLPETECNKIEIKEPVAFKILMKRKSDDNRKYDLEIELLDVNDVEHPLPCECYLTKCILAKAHLESMNVDQDDD